MSGFAFAAAVRVLITSLGRRHSEGLRRAVAGRGFIVIADQHLGQLVRARQQPDVVLLDCGTVDDAVLTYCRRLRRFCGARIVAVTERAEAAAWLRGQTAGIDDFLARPFQTEELTARLRLSFRARRGTETPRAGVRTTVIGPLRICEDSRTVSVHGLPIDLRPMEYRLLVVLARQAGTAVDRHQLAAWLWPSGWEGSGRALEVHVASLRAKLGIPEAIATVRGVGYRLVTESTGLRLASTDRPAVDSGHGRARAGAVAGEGSAARAA